MAIHPLREGAAPSVLPPAREVRVIKDDAEALAVAAEVAAHLNERAAERDRERILPVDELKYLRDRGLGAITVPKQRGGAGVSALTLSRVVALIAGADPSIAQILLNDLGIGTRFHHSGSDAQKAHFYDLVLSGHGFGNATSELGTKQSNVFNTKVTRHGESYLLNGQKYYTTGSLLAHYISVAAIDDDGKVASVLVGRDDPGVTIIDDWNGFGQRTSASGTLVLDNVVVPPIRVVRSEHVDQIVPQGSLAQLIHASIDQGIAEAAHRATLDYVRSRTRPWRNTGLEHGYDDPYIIAGIGEHETRLHAAEAMLARAAGLLDIALETPSAEATAAASVAVAEAKILTTEVALLVTSRLFQFAGARSTDRNFGFDRYLRDARVHTAHDPLHWKFHLVGNYHLNGRPPARDGSV